MLFIRKATKSKKLASGRLSLKMALLSNTIPLLLLGLAPAAYAQTTTNTATIDVPSLYVDPVESNNSATDTDSVTPVAASGDLPPNPSAQCTINWHRWRSARQNGRSVPGAVNPTTHGFEKIDTALGTQTWYSPIQTFNSGIDSFDGIRNDNYGRSVFDEVIENPTSARATRTGEGFYGIARFELEPNVRATIPLRDPGLVDGHAFIAYNSSGSPLSRFPSAASVATTGKAYIAANSQAAAGFVDADGIDKDSGWSDDTFEVDVPSDGLVYVHYVLADEGKANNHALRYCPEDVGDAPISYGVAAHTYDTDFLIGAKKDIDINLSGDGTAAADDNDGDGDNDEDGITLPTFTAGESATITADVSGAGGYLQAWIDFDGSGTFEPGEQVATNLQDGDGDGEISITVNVPSDAVGTETIARFRWASIQNLDHVTAAPDGEVEDYTLTVQTVVTDRDYSDAPISYLDASHEIVSGIQLGTAITAEGSGYDDANAAGDTSDDGITVPTNIIAGQTHDITIDASAITGSGVGTLHGWIDFDGSGTFEADEYASAPFNNGITNSSGGFPNSLTFSNYGTVAPSGNTFARFRLTSDSLTAVDFASPASDGEVEDYQITINPSPFPLIATPSQCVANTRWSEIEFTDNALSGTAANQSIAKATFSGSTRITSPGNISHNFDGVTGDHTIASAALPLDGAIFLASATTTLNEPISWDLSGAQVDEARLHFESFDGLRFSFDAANNPGVGWEILSSVRTNNRDVAPDFNIGDSDSSSGDGSWGDTQSANGTLRFFSLTGEPLSNLEIAIRSQGIGRGEGAAIALETCATAIDYSDGPTTGTSYGDASHTILTGIRLGDAVTAEVSGYDDANAAGDSDDGITLPTLTQGINATITADVTGTGGFLQGWIDFNGNGEFEASEQVATNLQDGDGDGEISISVNVPSGAVTTQTFARFRWSTTEDLGIIGAASDGEVEDYALTIEAGGIPFTCTGEFFQVTANPLRATKFDLVNSTLVNLPNVPSAPLNATGYRVADNFTYGVEGGTNILHRVDATGESFPLGPVAGLTSDINAGTFAGDGYLHMRDAATSQTFVVDVDNLQIIRTYSSGGGNLADTAYNPVDGRIYGLAAGTADLFAINPATGATSRIGTSDSGTGVWGAAFADADGNIFASDNASGAFYRFDATTARSTFVGTVSSASGNDGFSCPAATFEVGTDYSDAPSDFGDAAHDIDIDILLGSLNDPDAGTLASADANGDGSEDDGITLPALTQGQSASFTANVSGTGGFLQGWIDWDGDNNFTGTNDQIALNLQDDGSGDDLVAGDGKIEFSVAVPADAVTTQTFARFRWSTTSGLGIIGAASDGEVEDYALTVAIGATIDAVNDDFTASPISVAGGSTPSVFAGDDYDGETPTATSVDVTLTDLGELTGATINADGTIEIPADTPAGTYTVTYQICEAGATTLCDTATATILIEASPSLSLTKEADDDTDRKPGETITYTYTAQNTGDVNIEDVSVSDVHEGTGTLSDITIGTLTNTSGNSSDDGLDNAIDILAPDDSVTFEATYVVTNDDVIAGIDVANIATVTGTPSQGTLSTTPVTAEETVSIAPLDADLSITKTNTAGVNGELDQADDTLTSGTTTTYTLVVTNNGPDSFAGAVVTDVVGSGLSCNPTDAVTLSGDGIPAGSFTIEDLTGAGITLGELADGDKATFVYTCEVN